MIKELLQPDIQLFIKEQANTDVRKLALQKHKYSEWPFDKVLDQIKSRQRAKKKLLSWYQNESLLFPPAISIEQCSSEATARYKASLVSGISFLDLTGGFGIDTSFLSGCFKQSTYVERNQWLCQLAEHNFKALELSIKILNSSAEEELDQDSTFDLIYIDPARRNDNAQKIIRLEDYSPNVLELLPKILEKADRYMIKVSPMFDIKLGIEQLKGVEAVHVVSLKNEVKELLFIGSKQYQDQPIIKAVNLESNNEVYKFNYAHEMEAAVPFGSVSNYLYEPNASIIKAGAFKSLASTYGLTKLHTNTQLYTSADLKPNFPGRVFQVIDEVKPNKKEMKRILPELKANISVRNYPLSVEQIRKKTGLKEGGIHYIFGFTDFEAKRFVLCEKL